ncbi:TPA: hypothetical protein ACGTRX_004687, partial [Vibrio parahaemolyticus]|uniref:hypothetical protein n=2 Tax=Vibrio parahaemolyticus TaxID=670 RepID=UPI001495B5E0|nr:hypothetical protein [Vibrio parahaemolyticus]EIQ1511474.1 hypothetical protein [Vibrio parahaemolyticus]EJG2251310.1 hypothetical protein [Vibrio parahaemolyticus]
MGFWLMGNKRKNISSEKWSQIFEMKLSGIEPDVISEFTGVSKSAIYTRFKKHEFIAFYKDKEQYDKFEKNFIMACIKYGLNYFQAKDLLFTLPKHRI